MSLAWNFECLALILFFKACCPQSQTQRPWCHHLTQTPGILFSVYVCELPSSVCRVSSNAPHLRLPSGAFYVQTVAVPGTDVPHPQIPVNCLLVSVSAGIGELSPCVSGGDKLWSVISIPELPLGVRLEPDFISNLTFAWRSLFPVQLPQTLSLESQACFYWPTVYKEKP